MSILDLFTYNFQQVEDFDEASNEVKSPRDIYRLVKQGTKSILKNNGGVKKKVKKKSDTERAAGHNKASSVPAVSFIMEAYLASGLDMWFILRVFKITESN